jgi:hypothetical protein
MKISPEQIAAKWPIGKIIELSHDTRVMLSTLTKISGSVGDFSGRFYQLMMAGITGEEGITSPQDALRKAKAEMLQENLDTIDLMFFNGSGITLEEVSDMGTADEIMTKMDVIKDIMWTMIYHDMKKQYEMTVEEWKHVDLQISREQPGIVKVVGLDFSDE